MIRACPGHAPGSHRARDFLLAGGACACSGFLAAVKIRDPRPLAEVMGALN